ncbi:DUF6807 family protein [Lacipirellula sp.]|uniref:DUF6807 family protein n=1 Tax=Lacipirellula sp. TaxID=2691419 RepID=UPI003D0BA48C
MRQCVIIAILWSAWCSHAAGADVPRIKIARSVDSLKITVGEAPFATFVYRDEKITRPYFAHVRAPNGVQVTRSYPPVEGSDPTDHPEFHPGIWLAFGDVSGSDGWRLKAPVRFERFVEEPHGGAGEGGFAAEFSHRDQADPEQVICRELLRCDLRATHEGTLLLWDSTFTGDREFAFGDQEEMGLGVRMATPLRAEQVSKFHLPAGNGEIVTADGKRNEREVWGTSPAWCDYRGVVDGKPAGVAIFCHPENFRPSRFHVRDYGLMVANPFGKAAFKAGEPSRVTVRPGEELRLRYGVLVHGGESPENLDLDRAFKQYVEITGD